MELQEERIVQYCQANGLELVEILREPAVSAAKVKLDKRPVGSQLATSTFLSHTPARHIVALKLDRLFRNAVDALTHVEEWEKAGIHFHLVDFGGQAVNSSTPVGMMMLTMLAGFAAFERDLIAERTTAALRHKKANGEVYNHPPFGYDAVDGKLVPNVSAQRVITEMTRLRGHGMSFHEIADRLNQLDIATKRGGQWAAQTVINILYR